ncbi:hypothetical protein M9H77_21139 [Catharanthus roseus]|uniref:Uncharacterized protein n=1 Tax=Catharanthus roseus TaxID=4058 RepID=A0ACC0AQQ3_CATRO|nr:hypothetical protein M9H77_21139 [Catharanthus roseus]
MRPVSLIFSVDVSVAIYSSLIVQSTQLCTAALGGAGEPYSCYRFGRGREVDDMDSGVIQAPPSSPAQIASFTKKVQTIIRSATIASSSPKPVPDRGARGVKRGPCRLPSGGAREGRAPAPPDIGRGGHADPGRGRERSEASGERGRGDLGSSYRVNPFDSPNLGFWSFQSPHPSDLGFSSFQGPSPPGTGSFSFQALAPPSTGSSSFQAPLPPGTVSSSIPHMPISIASSSDSDEHDNEQTDVVTLAQQLGFGHRVRKKTTKFMPSN